jgi:hypothetical protein
MPNAARSYFWTFVSIGKSIIGGTPAARSAFLLYFRILSNNQRVFHNGWWNGILGGSFSTV